MIRRLPLLALLPVLCGAALAAPTPLPLTGTSGFWFYLPVQPGHTVTVEVQAGIRSVTAERPNPDYRVTRKGNVLRVTLRPGAVTGRGGQEGSTLCLTIRATRGLYRLCPTAEAQSVGTAFVLKK